MKLTVKQAVDQLQFASEKASDICRQLAFAVFAIAWIFRTQVDSKLTVPELLAIAALFATIVLLVDLIQYVYGVFSLKKTLEREGVSQVEKEIEVDASGRFISALYYCKIILITVAYTLVLYFFLDTLL